MSGERVLLLSPAGEIVEVECVQRFCRDHDLGPGNLRHVIDGARQHHKGWRSAEIPTQCFDRKPYAIERYLNEEQTNVL